MGQNGLTFPVALDSNGRVGSRYGVQAIPTTFIIDRRGLIVSRVAGALEWNGPEIVAAFEALLNE
jgi:peroxiredoxin